MLQIAAEEIAWNGATQGAAAAGKAGLVAGVAAIHKGSSAQRVVSAVGEIGAKSGAKTVTQVGVQTAAVSANSAVMGSATTAIIGTGIRAGGGRVAVVIPQTAALGATQGALAAAVGPAGWVATGANIAGTVGGEFLGEAIAGEEGAAIGKEVGGIGGSVGGGAIAGACVAGPIGAAAGAGVGAAVYGIGKVTDWAVDAIPGQLGSTTIGNTGKDTVTVYSYDYGDFTQYTPCRDSLVLAKGQKGNIAGSAGFLALGAECDKFYVHIYKFGFCTTSGYGHLVHVNEEYTYNGKKFSIVTK